MVREARFSWDSRDEAFFPSGRGRSPDFISGSELDWPDDPLELLPSVKSGRRRRNRRQKQTSRTHREQPGQGGVDEQPRHLADADWLHPRRKKENDDEPAV